ncbi:MAG TPA: alpha-amylase/4-alpha-glucanotransferase domain-containing protein [Candidatus Limnocylindrales bacterium]|nr:alpha-amylase/4-alpha-glucanotransferase domain-containing protein [Candidatus Limnocylindrales bacterium]
MTPRIGLALTLHNHQPVGNFGWVIAETYEHAYLPMLEALERHPGVRLALHYTGPLVTWLRAEHPEFLERLAALVARDQVEIVGGGWYEPVLASLPERDRLAQLRRMADELERQFGRRPRGAWLAERVWEPDLPTALVDGGYEWTILDDAHFRAAAIPEDALWGPYTTDDQGKVLTVYGTELGLRYHIPFSPVEAVIEHLRANATEAGDRVGTMGDDGEKFGAWPTTYEHCWTNGWVDEFFSALESNADWLHTVTPSRWLDEHAPIGRVYLPTGSYAEMGEWALPADEALAYHQALSDARDAHRPEERWLRGAMWRNFQVRYREINDLHKQMLRASALVEAMPAGPRRERALDHLLAGQSNDPYWHGLFGGIYLPDLRLANHANLIAAEDVAIGDTTPDSGIEIDLDLDGKPEVLLADAGQIVGIKPDEGAGIGRWDLRAARFALAAVLRRRPEAYHAKVRQLDARERGDGHVPDGGEAAGDGEAASIHDIVMSKQTGLSAHLAYDRDERRSGLLRLLPPDVAPDGVAAAAEELGDFASGAWTVADLSPTTIRLVRDGTVRDGDDAVPVRGEKRITIGGGRLDPTLGVECRITNQGDRPVRVRLALEWSTMLLGGGGNPAAWSEADGEKVAHDAVLTADGLVCYAAGNDFLGIRLDTTLEPPGDVWIAPIQTVSNSEGGFELVYQGSAALVGRIVELTPGATATIGIRHAASVRTDAASAAPGDAAVAPAASAE